MFKISAAFLLVALPLEAAGSTLQDCLYCLTDELPGTVQCDLDTDTCDLSLCGIGTEEVDFEACGCTECVDPIINCFDACTPPCLDTVVEPFVDCMVTPECYEPCAEEAENQPEGPQPVGVLPPLQKPEPCNFWEFVDDPIQCLFPIFPTCGAVQTDFVDVTCDLVSCCSGCHVEMTNIFDCFYNWASGYDCDFSCPVLTRHGRDLLTAEGAGAPSLARRRNEGEENSSSAGVELGFVEECRNLISQELVEKPEDIVGAYMSCIISNTMERVTSEENKPKEETTAPVASNGDDESGSSASSLLIRRGVAAVLSIALSVVLV